MVKLLDGWLNRGETACANDATPESKTMIPAIGLMIAAYTLTRLLELAMRPDRGIVVKIAAVLAMFMIAVCALFLVAAGGTAPSGFR